MDPIAHMFFHGQNAAIGVLNVGLGLFYSSVILIGFLIYERIRSNQKQKQLNRDRERMAALMRVQARKDITRFERLFR